VTQEFVLYVKTTCPWCVSAKRWLKEKGYTWREIDVLRDSAAFAEMERISGQRFVPTLVVGEQVLSDFGIEELEAFLQREGLSPGGVA